MLELYEQIDQKKEINWDDSLEQRELQLSGLVVKFQGKLLVNNRIYKTVFNQKWIEEQLNFLCPYSENFRAWLASERQDESQLLRDQALSIAEEWTKNKQLSYQERQFFDASRNFAEKANRQAQRKIRLERIISFLTGLILSGSIISTGVVMYNVQMLEIRNEELTTLEKKNNTQNNGKNNTQNNVRRQCEQFRIWILALEMSKINEVINFWQRMAVAGNLGALTILTINIVRRMGERGAHKGRFFTIKKNLQKPNP